jgi:hypothetical protein
LAKTETTPMTSGFLRRQLGCGKKSPLLLQRADVANCGRRLVGGSRDKHPLTDPAAAI